MRIICAFMYVTSIYNQHIYQHTDQHIDQHIDQMGLSRVERRALVLRI